MPFLYLPQDSADYTRLDEDEFQYSSFQEMTFSSAGQRRVSIQSKDFNLTGNYSWHSTHRGGPGQLRPLREKLPVAA